MSRVGCAGLQRPSDEDQALSWAELFAHLMVTKAQALDDVLQNALKNDPIKLSPVFDLMGVAFRAGYMAGLADPLEDTSPARGLAKRLAKGEPIGPNREDVQ